MSAKASVRVGSSQFICKFNRPSLKANAALLAAGLVALQAVSARGQAQSGTWIDPTSGGNWSNSANWQSGLVAGGGTVNSTDGGTANGNSANFNTSTLTGPMTVHLDTSEVINYLNLGDVGNAYGWTIDNNNNSSNTLTLQGNTYHGSATAGTLPDINVANQVSTISANLAIGENGYTGDQWEISGNGTLNLTGVDTWTSGFTMTGGTTASPLTLNLNLSSGSNVGGLGAYNANGDYYSFRVLNIANVYSTDVAVLNVNSGILNGAGLRLGGNNGGTATVSVGSGGTLNIGGEGLITATSGSSAGTETMNIAPGATVTLQSNGSIAGGGYYGHAFNVNQTGGLFAFYSDSGSTLGGTGLWNNSGGTETYNLSGGTFSLPGASLLGVGGGEGGGTSIINLNGGTLQTTGSGNFVTSFNTGGGTVGAFNINVFAGGGSLDTHGGSVTINTPLTHGGSATIDGGINVNDSATTAGTLTLYNGANTYTGPTTITRGTLAMAGSTTISSSSAINIGPSGKFDVSAFPSGFTTLSTQPLSGAGAIIGTVTAPAGSITAGFGGVGGTLSISGPLTLSGASTAFDLSPSAGGANGQIAANGGLTITAPTTVDAIFPVLPISSQTYTLFSYTGSALTPAEESDLSLSLANSAAGYNATQFALNYSTAGQVNLVYTPASGASSNLIWASTSSHVWDISTTANWNKSTLGSGANAVFNQGDNVSFADTAGVTTAITLNAVAEPSSVSDTASTENYTITGTGKISGTTNLTLSGNSTLTIGTSNDFTGTTFITNSGTLVAVNTGGSATGATGVQIGSSGTLQIGNNSTTGAGIITGTIADNGSLVLDRPDAYSLSIDVTGTGTLTQAGSGTSTLAVAQGYSGPTNVSGGTLQYGLTNALPYFTNLTLSNSGTLSLNNFGQTFDNVVTSGPNTTIALGTGNIVFNTTSPDVIQGAITGGAGSQIILNGTSAVTLSGNVSTATLSLANQEADKVFLNIATGANIAVTAFNLSDGGSATGGTAVVNQTGGVVSASTVVLANQSGVTNNAIATYNISGGALNISSGLTTSLNNNTRSYINVSGTGTINMLGNSSIVLGQFYGEPTTINQTGGGVIFANGSTGALNISGEGTYTWNLSGGVAAIPAINWSGQALNNAYSVANGKFNFNGGTLRTTANNSAFFPANVYAGTGGALSAQWTTTVQSGGAIIDTDGNAVTFTNSMIHDPTLGSTPDGGLTLNDSQPTPGTLTLAGSNTYTGNTTITNGTLALGPTGSINASPFINVGPHGIFNIAAQPTYSPAVTQVLGGIGTIAGPLTLTQGIITGASQGSAGTLTFSSLLTLAGGTSLFDLAPTSLGSSDLLVANGGLNVSAGSIIDAVFATAPSSAQTYVLFNYSGAALNSTEKGLLSLSAAGSASGVTTHNLSLSFNNSDQVLLTFTPGTGTASNLIWASTSSTAWDTSSVNWHNPSLTGSGPNASFFQGDNVTFDDTAGVKTAITLNIAAQPNSVTISSNTNNFSFTGSGGITGATGLNKTGSSTLTLGTANGYSGPTNLSGGTTIAFNPSGYATGITSTTIASGATFNIGNGSTTGAGNATGAITNNGTLNLDRPDAFTFAASVSGNAFLQEGAGLATLSGVSTYSGGTSITAGGLQLGVNNALPTGTNVDITSTASGTAFGLGSFSQAIGHFNDLVNNTLALGTGQLTILTDDNSTIAGPVTGGAGSALIISSNDGNNATISNNVSAGTLSVAPLDTDYNATLTISSGNITVTNLDIADGGTTGGTGQINQNAGTVSAANVNLANNSSIPGNANATYDLNGGTLNVSTGILMSNNNGTDSMLNIGPGATLNLLGNSSITLGNYYGQPASIDQTGGSVLFANGSTGGLQINGGGIYSYTLGGGELSIPRITWGGQAASQSYGDAAATFEFNGGTLQVTAAGQFFPSTVSVSGAHWITTIGSGGAIVDTAGNSVLFTNSLKTDPSTSTDGGLTKIGLGTLTLAGANTYNGATNVSVGTLALATSSAYPSGTPLTIAANAQFNLLNHGGNSTIVPVISTLTNNGTIDVSNDGFVVQTGSFTTISNQIKIGYNSGKWNGSSGTSGVITSSSAAADATHLTAVGVATGLTSFEGSTVSASNVEVKDTYYGDANLDGMVDGTDYSIIDANYLSETTNHTSISGWDNGDFNYDGVINGSDYTLMDNAFNTQGAQISGEIASPTAEIAGEASPSAVPEPTTLGLLGIGAAGLLGRRRRR